MIEKDVMLVSVNILDVFNSCSKLLLDFGVRDSAFEVTHRVSSLTAGGCCS